MNQGGRILLLGTAVVLLIVGVVCLKQQLGDGQAPPAFLPAEESTPKQTEVPRQPTILSADPNSAPQMSPSWRDANVLPFEPEPQPIPTIPVNSETAPQFEAAPNGPPAALDDESQPPVERPQIQELPFNEVTSVPGNLEPVAVSPHDSYSDPVAAPVADPPAVIVTQKDDSLWLISEKVYGQGMYFRALFAMNRARISRPDRIEAGIELVTPSVEDLQRLYPELCPNAG